MNSDTPRTNEEIIDAAHCAECGYEVVLADAMRTLERELTELGKERAADKRLLEIVLSDLQKTTADADNLLKEQDQLKRELSEAQWHHEQLEAASRLVQGYQTQLLALSASHQRQKEALNEVRKAVSEWDGGGAGSACRSLIQVKQALSKALAETPNVSLLDTVNMANKIATEEMHDCGCSDGSFIYGCTHQVRRLRQLLSTLQPDHQK